MKKTNKIIINWDEFKDIESELEAIGWDIDRSPIYGFNLNGPGGAFISINTQTREYHSYSSNINVKLHKILHKIYLKLNWI